MLGGGVPGPLVKLFMGASSQKKFENLCPTPMSSATLVKVVQIMPPP